MSLDLFMNHTCPNCRKPINLTDIKQHRTRGDLAVHTFECADCGAVKTRILFRKREQCAA
jgi:ssDNA-binding Zn-finger/Zn-ribbon topoisomerase 1